MKIEGIKKDIRGYNEIGGIRKNNRGYNENMRNNEDIGG